MRRPLELLRLCCILHASIRKGIAMPFRRCTLKNLAVQMLAAIFLLVLGSAETGMAQNPPPLNIFTNYFVTGDYVVGGWVENPNLFANGFATGTISIPDCTQYQAMGQACPASVVPQGADIVAAYLYWATVEGNQSTFAGQQAVFNGYNIVGKVLGNPNAPTSWSSGGCTGSSVGSKTMRMYRADVRPYLPLDPNSGSPTFGAIIANPTVTVKIADSGSNGNTQPNALGATLVLIYRLLSPPVPLNAIVLYDGSYAPSNAMPTMTQNIVGFYQPSGSTAKITHIVANGQPNKLQTAFFGPDALHLNQQLPILYPGFNTPFPGIYGTWDNPTWPVSVTGGLAGFDTTETTAVSPTSTNGGCVNWGAVIFSTPVQDSDGDGLLDTWEQYQGYTDAVSGNQILLPGADPGKKDLFVQVDYLTLRDPKNPNPLTNVLHSHLPKQQALHAVGQAFFNQHINVHFDLPPGVYTGDQYVISTGANQPGVGGNEIPENSLVTCAGVNANCAFPNQPAVSWKGGVEAVQNTQNPNAALGNLYFQTGRGQSYRYVLFGHSMGEPRFYWNTLANKLATVDPGELGGSAPQLVSIVDVGNTATVTIKSPTLINGTTPPKFPPLVVKPGDCTTLVPPPQACGDANNGTVTISGSLTPAPFTPGTIPPTFPLNGTYIFTNASSSKPDANGVITTTFTVTTAKVPDGTYQFSCPAQTAPACVAEPQLGVSYLGPTTTSGHADFGGGGDVAVTLGLWGADDAAGCQPDPSQPAGAQGYCNNLVGTLKVQTGTLMHELGHTLTLTHGGTYYQQPGIATYDLNCKSNFLSVMNYLFQVRGFPDVPDGGFDYSGQMLPQLNETSSVVNGIPALNETTGVGVDPATGTAQHLTRWYSTPNATDAAVGNLALGHCDGSPLAQGEPSSARVDGTLAPGGTFSAPLDWNNDLIAGDDPILGQDLNHNGNFNDPPFLGFNDWDFINPAPPLVSTAFQQINARSSGFGFSEGGGLVRSPGSGLVRSPGGGVDGDGSGLVRSPGSGLVRSPGSGLVRSPGGGEQNTETANSVVDSPGNLACTTPVTLNGVTAPACTASTGGTFFEKAKAVPLTWTAPDFGQIRHYFIWRAVGNFQTPQQVKANINKFSEVGSVDSVNSAAGTSTIDTFQLKSNTTYTYFVTDQNLFQAKSRGSKTIVVTLQF
jgi:hypothetical protein